MTAVTIALRARHEQDWAQLAEIWVSGPTREFYTDPRSRQAYLDLPDDVRRAYPVLTRAAAVIGATEAGVPDLSRSLVAMVRDGRVLHARWASHDDPDAALLAGTFWMLAQTGLPGIGPLQGLSAALETEDALEKLILRQTRTGRPPRSKIQAFFHCCAATTSTLLADYPTARRHAGLAVALSADADLVRAVAAALLVLASAFEAESRDVSQTSEWLHHISIRDPALVSHAQPVLNYPQALEAIRLLDRPAAERRLARIHDLPWADLGLPQPLGVFLRSRFSLLWLNPEYALAELDAGTAGWDPFADDATAAAVPLARARIDILLRMGRLNAAQSLITRLEQQRGRVVAVPQLARMFLLAADYERCLEVVEEGGYAHTMNLHDRAQLRATRAAALLGAGADPDVVAPVLEAACLICGRARTLLPFALLPPDLRPALLGLHRPHPGSGGCILLEAEQRHAFDGLSDPPARPQLLVRLTPREQELLPLLATGAPLREIAATQFVSLNTVRKQLVTLREKFGAGNREELLALTRDLGLLDSRD